ncbi:MAG: phosphoribosylaminoimidazolesuccinocarboxamide synthase [Candidatus Saelkia tenebricola]|nr:phosphoribosylaminoimidazolesuccinocarboxamide synthase [Candidatus Saelkia tenebricola]
MKVKLIEGIEIPELKLFKRGKVRDVYECRNELLFVATDRISCFDVVLLDAIPYKGIVLTQLSSFWFDLTKDIVKNHIFSKDISDLEELASYREDLKGRSVIVKKSNPVSFECVVRGYLAGSGWKDYQKTGSVSGVKLPTGLIQAQKLPEPIFTPSTKEDTGHDMAVSFDYVKDHIGVELASKLRDLSIRLYQFAENFAAERGIIIADTKFEFGLLDDNLILIDEILTPDSSRFWPKDQYLPGKSQVSFDKQYVRDWLEATDWDKTPPAPRLPQEVIEKTSDKYLLAYKMLAGEELL